MDPAQTDAQKRMRTDRKGEGVRLKKSVSYGWFAGKRCTETMRIARDAGFEGIEVGRDDFAGYPFNAGFHVKFGRAVIIHDASGLTVYPLEGKPFPPDPGEDFKAENCFGGNLSSPGGYHNELRFFIEGVPGSRPPDVAALEETVRSVRLIKREIGAAGGLIAR